jgi:hypothetical protein
MILMFTQRRCELAVVLVGVATAACLLGCGPSYQAPNSGDRSHAENAKLANAEEAIKPDVWPTPHSDQSEFHAAMVWALQDIVRQTPGTNVWVGDAEARRLREELQSHPEGASLAAIGRVKTKLAEAELKLGNEEEAIRLLRECDEQHLPTLTADWPPDRRRALAAMVKFSLGISYMRLGETQNCCQRNSPESCIMPIQGSGIHANPEGSRRAIDYFVEVLESSDDRSVMHLRARWLLNIAHMTLGEYPDGVPPAYLIPPDRLLAGEPFPKFPNVAQELGVATFSLSGGAIADDFDNDGHIDLVVSDYSPDAQLRFFHNDGDGSFTERTAEAGLVGITGGLNLVQADYDNDGWLDILVLRGAWLGSHGNHPNSLLRNDGVPGAAQFTDVTFPSGLAEVSYPTQTAAWADFDADGDLDLYIGNEADKFDPQSVAAPCQLFRNNGDGTFDDIAPAAGVTNDRFTKAVISGDYDNDRLPDLYVSNFLDKNRLYRNNGDGTFRDVAARAGVTGPHASFPAWFWDFDNDGNLDIYASSWAGDITALAADALELPHNAELASLYRGNGQGSFVDVASQVGLTRPTGPMGSNFGDINGDGYCDFYLGTGEPEFMNLMPNVMYVNHGGTRFADVTMSGGFGHLQKGHAVAFADFDNDGDQDVFEQMGGAYPGDKFYDALYRNPGFGTRWLTLKLEGRTSNRSAIGARIRIDALDAETGQLRTIYRWVNSGGSFGANPLRQTIGLGKTEGIRLLEVFWPTTGKTQRWTDIPLDAALRVIEGENRIRTL